MKDRKAKISIENGNAVGRADPNLFGSFVEHLGRCVYQGIYEPGHAEADEFGFRKDVTKLVRELRVPVIRYPGGNFVSDYRWEDGVGPVEDRPVRLNSAWRALETNIVGTNEFVRWCRGAGAEPMLALNLGTRGIQSAVDLLEYCNHPSGTYLSDLRIRHGYKEPHNVRYWCLGNEMDGPWQIGHKTPEEYGRLAAETAKAMRMVDPDLKLISCGSSNSFMPTFPRWEAETLWHTYDFVDYISLHQYFEKGRAGTAEFLAQSIETDRFIRTVIAVCDYVKAQKRGTKDIMLSFDEWNLWYHTKEQDDDTMTNHAWSAVPRLLEDVYTFEDALLEGCMLITFLRHVDRLKMACMAQLVNVIAPIMTEPGGGLCRQTTFYPFLHVSRYGRGEVMRSFTVSPQYDCGRYAGVPELESAVVRDTDTGELTVFAVNRNLQESLTVVLYAHGFGPYRCAEHIAMESPDLNAVNTPRSPRNVCPFTRQDSVTGQKDGSFEIELHPASWNVIRLCPVSRQGSEDRI